MTAENQNSGFGEAGLREVQPLLRRPIRRVDAKVYDPETQTFLVDGYGQFQSQHPVDAWVALQLTLFGGSMPSAVNAGNPGLTVTHQGSDYVNRVTDLIAQKLQPKVSTNEISIRTIRVTALGRKGTAIEVEYKNLALANTPVRVARI